MSLKAKLEAVIYAAEEPVTLVQLAALFATEAIEWKEARKAAFLGIEEPVASAAEEPEATPAPESTEESSESAPDAEVSQDAQSSTDAQTVPDAPSPVDAESELKRLARQRDREVRDTLRELIDEIAKSYTNDERGIEIREVAGGYRMATKPEFHDAVRAFVKSLKPPLKLSLPALETLAVIAYKQPVTAPEVSEIRGVDTGGVLGSLISRKLITTAGRKQVIGRPILYKTTREFLLRFGLKDISELPSMEEFEKMAAIELDETDTPEEIEENEEASNAAEDSRHPEFEEDADEDQDFSEDTAVRAESAAPIATDATESNTPAEPAETEATPHGSQ